MARSAPSSCLQIQRRPVEHRAFGDHRQQRHQSDQIDQRVCRQREFVMLGRLRPVLGDRGSATATAIDRKGKRRHHRGVGEMAVVLDGEAAEGAAGETAKAPEAVRGRHDGAGQPPLDHHRIGIHGDVHAADRAAEDEHGDGRQRHVGRQRHDQQAEAAAQAEPAQHGARAMPRDQVAAPGHGRDGAGAEQEDQQAERELRNVEPGQEHRDLRRPAAGQEAVGEENGRHGPSPANGGLHGVLRVHQANPV